MLASNFQNIYISILNVVTLFSEIFLWIAAFGILYFYGRFRRIWWRKILSAAIDYHRFHLSAMQADKGLDEKTREYATALQWAINKQLPDDLKKGGGLSLWLSFAGAKTSLNTCGTVFYDAARYSRFIDSRIIKLNDTLLSTFYRILFIESVFFPLSIPLMDFFFLMSLIKKPERGSARLYLEMSKDKH
ncbi:MAG TPA: hypothetical protein PLN03_05670 [Spirochaetota bacterium]|nr:hypothetical protein [Spirochaetota bacterium]HOK92293.1 hypothetical protein [Spirochaetota bacterium]HPD78525.1 hypothetical protein [Spirochaetota bacterium]HPX90103.1 hypothetical protein [Spirochaetota bacterium]HRU65575.1 hypothetical protein [Spirochaetota bacterium]